MADITIPQLNAATSVSGTDVMVISQAGVTKKVEVDKLLAEVRSDLNEKIEKNAIKQITGSSETDVMSQKAVSDKLTELTSKYNIESLKKSYNTLADGATITGAKRVMREIAIHDALFEMKNGGNPYLNIRQVRKNYTDSKYCTVQINLCSEDGESSTNIINPTKGLGSKISDTLEYFEFDNNVLSAKIIVDWSYLDYMEDGYDDAPSGHRLNNVFFSEHYGMIQMLNAIPKLREAILSNTININDLNDKIKSTSVLLPHTYLNPNNGAFGTDLENWTTSYMQVKGGSKYYFVDNNKSTSARWGIFLSFDGRYPINMVEGSTNQRESITVPSDNEFYWIAISVNRITESLCIQDNTTILGSIASLRNLIESNGEEVLWLGTSIPAAGRYPENACDALGYKLYNMSLGASGICRDGMNGMLNPGYGGRSGLDLAESIEEKEERYRHLVTEGTITESQLELWKTYGYEKRLIPYIDGTIARCSIIVFDHGYNDRTMMAKDVINWDSINKSIYRDDSSFNRIDSYTEAFCYLLKKIYTVNPNIKIVICSYLENQSEQVVRGGKDICNIQSKIADHFGFDFLPLYAHIGFFTNSYLPSTDTYMYLYNQEHGTSYPTYNWGGENPEGNVTRFQYYCPDGTHPHTDKTGRAENIISKAMIKLLGSI